MTTLTHFHLVGHLVVHLVGHLVGHLVVHLVVPLVGPLVVHFVVQTGGTMWGGKGGNWWAWCCGCVVLLGGRI